MALILKDRVRETSSSSGTGNITLGGAISGYQTFNAAIASGSTVYYTIHNLTAGVNNEWEVGVGTFTSPATLARDTVLSSSNSGSAVNFTAGASGLEVFITQPAEEAVYINQATGKVEAFGNGTNSISFVAITSDLFTGNGSAISAINASNIASGTIANARTTANSANGASTIVLRGASGEFAAGAITGTSFSGNGAAITAINATAITTGTLDNARTSAASANGASTIVARDANGSFSGNVITGTTGTFTNISGNGATLSAINASNISSGTLDNARTTAASANGANTIVLRDASGDFSVDGITANWFTGNGANLSAINASNVSSGTLSATNGGTGSANLTAENVILGNGASAVKVVAPGTANNVLTSNGSTWISQAVSAGGTVIPSGTVMLFAQTAAPTGFTKNTTTGDNSALRVTTGTASTGGSVAFTTAFASNRALSITAVAGSAGATTLSTPQIPSHNHTFTLPNGSPGSQSGASTSTNSNANFPYTTASTGGDGSHSHPFSFSSATGTVNVAVQYIDVIRATKD